MLKKCFYDKINDVWRKWDRIDLEEFRNYRISVIKKSFAENYNLCVTSGSSSCKPLKYKWGPNFIEHYNFYNKLFYESQNFIRVYMMPFEKNSYARHKNSINFGINDGMPLNREKKMQDMHIVMNPEVLYLYMKKYGDILEDFFNKKNCIFSFTGSPLKDEHLNLFENYEMKCKDHMRCWNGGATYFTCKFFNKHWLDISSIVEIENQNLISTDLWNSAQQFIKYKNNDRLISEKLGPCDCGLLTYKITWFENPKYFTVKNRQFSYEGVVSDAQKFGSFDFLTVSYNDEMVLIELCHSQDFDLFKFQKHMEQKLNIIVRAQNSKLPHYDRKYLRIKKLN